MGSRFFRRGPDGDERLPHVRSRSQDTGGQGVPRSSRDALCSDGTMTGGHRVHDIAVAELDLLLVFAITEKGQPLTVPVK